MKNDPPVCGLFMIGMDAWNQERREGEREREKADLADLTALLAISNNALLQ